MSSIAEVLFVAAVLVVFGVVFWRGLGASHPVRRGRRRSNGNAPEDATGGHHPTPVKGPHNGGADGAGAADGGGGDGGGGGSGGGD